MQKDAARMIQNAIDGEAPDFETIEELPSVQPDIPDMNVIIDTIKNAINASTGNEAYMVGLRNGMRWCLSALTDKEPEYEDMPSVQPEKEGDSMTPQKVSDVLIRIIDEDWHVYTDDAINALEYAAKVVEKEIPKQPIAVSKTITLCPSCKSPFIEKGIGDYCPECGQKIDWEEIDD